MLRRLIIFIHYCAFALRAGAYGFRGWLLDWFYILSTPFRAFRPRAWLAGFFLGLLEVLAMLRLVRPREFGSELPSGGREAVGMARGAANGVVSIVVEFFWLLVWLPLFLVRFCYHGPIRIWYHLRTRSRRQLVSITAAAAVVLVVVGGVPGYLWTEHRRTFKLSMLQRQYDDYLLRANDLEKLENALAELAAELPEDAAIARRVEIVRNREAPASEPNLVRFFMRHHMATGHVAESVREANKLLESFPGDWDAHIYLALAALSRGDTEAAKRQVANLPRVTEAAGKISGSVALISAQLFNLLGDQARYEEIVEFITLDANFLPCLQDRGMVYLSFPHKLFLIDCYYLALTRLDKRPYLTKYWTPLELAFQSIVDDPAADPPMLVQLGQAGQKTSLKWLQEFRTQRLISKDEYETMARDLLARQKVLWEKVIRLNPKLPGGYVGMAEYDYTVGAPEAAEQALARGLAECGAVPDLVVAAGKLLGLTDPNRGVKFLERTVRDEDMTLVMCAVVEEVATKAGRPDRALEACRRALKLDPKQDWARVREAAHCLTYQRPEEAVAALRPIEDHLVKYPDGCADYVRALSESGSAVHADEFLEKMTAADCPVDVLLKTAAGLQAARRNADALRWAKRALDREPRNVTALLAVADNNRILADRGENGWDIDLVREALKAYRAAEQQRPESDVADRIANNIAWLELKALGLPQEALASATRLRAIENNVETKAEYLETLGAIYIGVGRFDQAVAVLIQAIATAPRGSFYTHLAWAYQGLGQTDRAEWYLEKARRLPMTPMQLKDLHDASQIIHGR